MSDMHSLDASSEAADGRADAEVSDEERGELQTTLRTFFARHLDASSVIGHLETSPGYDPEVLDAMVTQLGLPALAIPERFGGMGYGWQELGVALSESGRMPSGTPFLSGQIVAAAVLSFGDEMGQNLILPNLAAGTTRYTTAGLTQHHWLPPEVNATAGQSMWTLNGRARFVLDVPYSDALVVLAQHASGARLFLTARSAPEVNCTPLVAMDMTRPLSDIEFHSAPAQPLSSNTITTHDIADMRLSASLLLAAEQLGGARGALETTVQYLTQRIQFGRALGSFQALKHRCADLHVAICGAQAVLTAALKAADGGADDGVLLAHLAAAVCSETYVDVAHAMIQLHGGIGFTWEHIAHVHLKRAKTSQHLFGTPDQHRAALAQVIGLEQPAPAGCSS